MKKTWVSWLVMMFLAFKTGNAQDVVQVVKGVVTDKTSEKPLVGASISLLGPGKLGTLSDAQGRYALKGIPIGRQKIVVTFGGYKPVVIPEVLVTAGKEVVLDVAMDQSVSALDEVKVSASRVRKGAAANEFAVGSNRSFNVDEVTRFAGGRNDPSKLVSNFAGVVAGNDSRNDIIVRGNSPTGVLWRIEGLPSPNPNHYSTPGTTGGPVSALNTNALKTSDFLTGAFPAEFGNATAAVFDINFRKGNADKHERTLQLNIFSGAEAMLEGPLGKAKKGGSYLVGYRYSFAQIGQSLGLNIGTSAVPKYQDWVYNIALAKGKAGSFNFYGMGGASKIEFKGKDLDSTDFYARTDQDSKAESNFSLFGVKHTLDVSKKSFIRTSVSFSNVLNNYYVEQYPLPFTSYANKYDLTSAENNMNTFRASSFLNSKVSPRFSYRAGWVAENVAFKTLVKDREGKAKSDPFNIIRDYDNSFLLLQGFAQLKYHPMDKLTFNLGVHGTRFSFNKTNAIEPRASISYQLNGSDLVFASFGGHSQLQPYPVYLYQSTYANGTADRSNRDLGLTKAYHYVAGYEKRFATDWRAKAEVYYQYIYDAPVESVSSGFSILNSGSTFVFPEKAGLVNKGTGKNTGVELTLERFLSNGYYLLFTTSIFDSKYKGSDGIERNSSFNYKNVFNVLAGKEWKIGKEKRNAFTFDMKLTSIGGKYATPIDLTASKAQNKEVLDESSYNAQKLDSYFRLDTKFGYRINSLSKKMSQTLYLDFQNVTNQQNVFLQNYNPSKQTIGTVYQIGFFPDLLYRITF